MKKSDRNSHCGLTADEVAPTVRDERPLGPSGSGGFSLSGPGAPRTRSLIGPDQRATKRSTDTSVPVEAALEVPVATIRRVWTPSASPVIDRTAPYVVSGA
jgi:hypothetical protein